MELLMKLNCSPTAPGNTSHTTLKMVDHQHRLQQHSMGPPMCASPHPAANIPLHPTSHAQTLLPGRPLPPHDMMLPACLEYTRAMDCCSVAVNTRNMNNCATIYGPPGCCGLGLAAYEAPTCCGGISYGIPPTLPVPLPPLTEAPMPLSADNGEEFNGSYEYHEPEENFVSIDDAKIKGLLLKIGQEQVRNESKRATSCTLDSKQDTKPIVYEIIDLDDDDDCEKLQELRNQTPQDTAAQSKARATPEKLNRRLSPDITLVPIKTKSEMPSRPEVAAPKENIIAQIELLDSSSESDANEAHTDEAEEYSDDEDLPLAAAAVSCELDCDEQTTNDVVVLPSDDEEHDDDYIDEHEEGLELRWDDLEEHKERPYFMCLLCGKKVQSSYNLRRHMMIHTGERPFACDMCDRRFREFSDLKKHRRRHVNDPNFVCMVCHTETPTEQDPTRCNACSAKNGFILAMMQPQMLLSPERSQSPPPLVFRQTISRKSTPPADQENAAVNDAVSPQLPELPPLTPINAMGAGADTQSLLDNVAAVQRPATNQQGVVTRKEFPCPLCQRPFGTRHNLKRHFMIHTGEKPFSCSKCRKPFREYSTLKKHMVTHQRERWYKCLRCPQKYRDYLEYLEHKKTHPKDDTSSGSNTSSPRKKQKAQRSQECWSYDEDDSTSEDWLECCECSQRFTDIDVYTEHLKEHDNTLVLYECYMCRKSFEEREALTQHVAEHEERSNYTTRVKTKPSKRAKRAHC